MAALGLSGSAYARTSCASVTQTRGLLTTIRLGEWGRERGHLGRDQSDGEAVLGPNAFMSS